MFFSSPFLHSFTFFHYIPPFTKYSGVNNLTRARRKRSFKYIYIFNNKHAHRFPKPKTTLRWIYIYIYKYIYHHHVALVVRIYLTLSHHSSQSFIALGRSSGQHSVSSHSCWMYVGAGNPAFARPCVVVPKSTSLMSSSLLLQQCPACLVRLTWIDFVIGCTWPYSWCLVGCCRQDFSRLLAAFLCNCRQASSPGVLLASM